MPRLLFFAIGGLLLAGACAPARNGESVGPLGEVSRPGPGLALAV